MKIIIFFQGFHSFVTFKELSCGISRVFCLFCIVNSLCFLNNLVHKFFFLWMHHFLIHIFSVFFYFFHFFEDSSSNTIRVRVLRVSFYCNMNSIKWHINLLTLFENSKQRISIYYSSRYFSGFLFF